MRWSCLLQDKTYAQIAEEVGYTPSHVGNIVNSEEGQRIIRAANRRIRQAMEQEIEGMIKEMKKTSLERIRETIDAEFHLGTDEKSG